MKTRAAELEEIFNNVKVHPMVSVGELLSTLLFLRLQKGPFTWFDILPAIKIIILPNPANVTIYEWDSPQDSKVRIFIGLASFSNRLVSFFKDLVCLDSVYKFDVTVPSNDCPLKVKSTHKLKRAYLPFDTIKEILLTNGVSIFEKIVILSLTQIQWIKFKFFLKQLKENQYNAVLLIPIDIPAMHP